MAKHIDTEKLERIQNAVVRTISLHGASNASVASIAKEAGVSIGYLYSHYHSKEDMINHMLEKYLDTISDKIEELLENSGSTHDIVRGFIEYIFERAENRPDKLRFILTLQNDFSYNMEERIMERLRGVCNDILERGKLAGVIHSDVTTEDLYVVILCMPLQFISARFRNLFFGFENSNQAIDRITDICLNGIYTAKE